MLPRQSRESFGAERMREIVSNKRVAETEVFVNGDYSLLFTLYLGIWSVGNGIIPLLPVRAAHLGLSPGNAGLLLASLYLALVIGSLVSPFLLGIAGTTKKAIIISEAVRMVTFPLLAYPNSIAFGIAGTICWLSFGFELCALKVHANLIFPDAMRGQLLGRLYITTPLGAVVGGTLLGILTNKYGFQAGVAVCSLIPPCAAIYALKIQHLIPPRPLKAKRGSANSRLPLRLTLLAVLNLIVAAVGLAARAATPLMIEARGLGLGTPAIISAIGGLCCLPLTPAFGKWSDRVGRPPILTAAYMLVSIGVATLIWAHTLFEFAVSSVLISTFLYAASGVRTAVVGDLARPSDLTRATSLYEAGGWTGGVIGFALASVAVANLGTTFFILVAVVGALAAVTMGAISLSTQK
jgi:MFS family permease